MINLALLLYSRALNWFLHLLLRHNDRVLMRLGTRLHLNPTIDKEEEV
jgi:hypothetical protein